ncbi:MAG: hypothetical protein K8W52_34125 [Deltaproteobacteria bacterium]|nr:hypothetical protein [Deltaproteobacteria bacterium]
MRIHATLALLLAVAAPASAGEPAGKPAALVGATQAARIAPDRGFVDDPIAADGARLAYVNTDGATFAELVVFELAGAHELVRTPLPAELGTASALRWVGAADKPRLFVVGRTEDGVAHAATFELTGKVGRKFGPAADIAVVVRDGKTRVALHRARAGAAGATTHELELQDVDTGKKVGKVKSLVLDAAGANKKLDFRVTQWLDGWTRARGMKGGHWDPKENQRTPDSGAVYDLLAGTFALEPIADPMEHARREQVIARFPGETTFVRMTDDLSTVELWADGAPTELTLDQPLAVYDASTLATAVDETGKRWVGLVIDPVNPAAVKRKKADVAYLDLFAVDGSKATRVARMLVTPKKKYRWGVAASRWWVVERSLGFDRGGTSVTVFGLGG